MEKFPFIPFIPPKKTVLRRLGSHKTSFSADLEKDIDRYLRLAEVTFHAAGKACAYPIDTISAEEVVVQGQTIQSRLLAKLLSNSNGVYFMCASIPKHEVIKINEAIRDDKGLKAIVLDAYASEYVDGVLDVIMERKNTALRRMGQKLTYHRFSPGYGDLNIEYQKLFFDLLDMQTLNVQLTDKYLLVPEKSVIAIAGVE